MEIHDFLSRFDGVAKCGGEGQWMACCPLHGDKHQSLSIGLKPDGKIVLKCHVDCDNENILRHFGLTFKDISGKGPRTARSKSTPGKPTPKLHDPDKISLADLDRLHERSRVKPRLDVLAKQTGIPEPILDRLEIGDNPDGVGWMIPERDGDGVLVGFSFRYYDGHKDHVAGTSRGLTFDPADRENIDPARSINVTEGMTDAASILWMGLRGVSRFSASGGAEQLAAYLAPHLAAGTDVFFVLDNDDAGERGGYAVAQKVANLTGFPVHVSPCPKFGGAVNPKDVREFVNANPASDKAELGTKFTELVKNAATEILPENWQNLKLNSEYSGIWDTAKNSPISTKPVEIHEKTCDCHKCQDCEGGTIPIWETWCQNPKNLFANMKDGSGTAAWRTGCRKKATCNPCLRYHRDNQFNGAIGNILKAMGAKEEVHKREIDRDQWDTVRRAIQRTGSNYYYKIPTDDGRATVIAKGPFPHSEAVENPIQFLRATIDRCDRNEAHTLTHSRGWPMDKVKREPVVENVRSLPKGLSAKRFTLKLSRNLGTVPKYGLLKGTHMEESAVIPHPPGADKEFIRNAIEHAKMGKEMTENRRPTYGELMANAIPA